MKTKAEEKSGFPLEINETWVSENKLKLWEIRGRGGKLTLT